MNNAYDNKIKHWLNDQPQLLPPRDGFDAIMDQLHDHKRKHSLRLPAIAAVLCLGLVLWLVSANTQQHEQQFKQLNDKVSLIEQVVRNEVINHSAPGSLLLEKMVSMENWLDQLDQNIAQTDDASQKLELLHAKLEILNDLVALHKKYQPQSDKQII